MTQPGTPQATSRNLQLSGGAAIVAPVSAFPGGVPANALVVIPVTKPTATLDEQLKKGPLAVTQEQMWELLGFNGPAVQVQDNEGRPITIGLEDLLKGLRDHWNEDKSDVTRGRMFASELMKYRRFEEAEKIWAKLVALGGGGDDWLALGVAQLQQEKFAEAEGTLKGARNLMPESPFPSLHLAKVYKGLEKPADERAAIEHAILVQPNSVDAWAVLYVHVKDASSEDAAILAVTELAEAEPNKKSAAPYVALQGLYANSETTRARALEFAKVAVDRNGSDPTALIAYTALLGHAGRIDEVVDLLSRHEKAMNSDVRLAHNYFEALMHKRDITRVTTLLNKLSASTNREVKQFAAERSRLVGQILAQQQAELARAQQGSGLVSSGAPAASSGLVGPGGRPLR